jgi:uncharacterized protein
VGPAKAVANRQKHGIDLADAIGVFEDTYALTRPDSFPGEERFVTLGRDLLDRVLVVVWTTSERAYRLISARRAIARERCQYAEDADA